MKIKLLVIASSFFITGISLVRAQIPPRQVVENSVNFHDPCRRWLNNKIKIKLRETRPGAADRFTDLTFNQRKDIFRLKQLRKGHLIEYKIKGGKVKSKLDGKIPSDTALINEFRIGKDRALLMRDFYTFLYGLPMKLLEEGTIIGASKREQFGNKEAIKVKVTFEPEVGTDTWYFYFDTLDYSMVGYRFYHKEKDNDGEYITLENTVIRNKTNFPEKRNWYTNDKDEYLGSDIIIK